MTAPCTRPTIRAMSTIEFPDGVGAALAAAADEAGTAVAGLISEMITKREPDALGAFIGGWASGRTGRFDVHTERAEIAACLNAGTI